MLLVKNITGCETNPVRGLDQQLIDEVNVIVPNVLINIEDLEVKLTGSSVWPLLQLPAKEALGRAIAERGQRLQVNSGYRPIAGQFVLFQNASECGFKVAPVGGSNHQGGLALDIEDNAGWRPFLERNGWQWFGDDDPVHFDFVQGGQDIRSTAILAFQRLWNRSNPNDRITEDGLYGEQTAERLGNSPAEGFPLPPNGGLPLEPGTYFLKCLGDVEGPRWLDGRTGDGSVGLVPNTDPSYTGTKWEVTFDEPASAYRFKCLGDVEGPRWLDGRTGDGSVGLAPNTDPPYTGTKWQAEPAVIPADPAILYELAPTGASAETAGPDGLPGGVESSRTMAETDAPNVLRFVERFQVAGTEYNLPPALLAAISSRESRGGSALSDDCLGDGGAGVGIMQVDQTVRPPGDVANPGPDCASQEHINQAASILRGFVDQAAAAHPEWSAAIQLQAGTASYNAGPDQIEKAPNFDEGTTGGDYSNDVIARAQYYADNWQPAAVA